ncbi:MAG: AI-2E family transporter [Chlamydiales bacterium]
MHPLITFTLSIVSIYILIATLTTASSFFIPLAIAIIIGFFIFTIAKGFEKLRFRRWKLPHAMSMFLSCLTIFFFIWVIVRVVSDNVYSLIDALPVYQQRFDALLSQALEYLNIEKRPDFSLLFERFDLMTTMSQVVFMFTEIAGYAGMITIYLIFILIEFYYIGDKIDLLFKEEKNRIHARSVINEVMSKMETYLRLKTLLSIGTAVSSYVVMYLIGVDFASFWALMIFLLNFIPNVGSIIATIFPCLLTLIQFGDLISFFIVSISLTAIQFTVGNIIEPKLVGKTFNLSSFVVVLFLVIWGRIWGILGMFLSVPILVIISIVLSAFPSTRSIAVLLSQDGNLNDRS